MIFIKYIIIFSFSFIFFGCDSERTNDAVFSDASSQTIFINGFDAVVDENAVVATVVGQILFTEPNLVVSEINLYGISATYFTVDLDGTVRVSAEAAFDAYIKEFYTLEAVVTSGDRVSNRAALNIRLSSLNVPRLENLSSVVDENATVGLAIGRVNIIDSGNTDISNMSLSGENADYFEIDIDGLITLSATASIRYDLKNLYSLEVSATNQSGVSLPREVIISVNQPSGQTNPNASELALVLIAISFDDYPIVDSEENWSKKIFGEAYGELNHYYREVSNSRFKVVPANENSSIVNDGVIKVSLSTNHPGNNDMNKSYLVDAITLADAFIDFSSYDTNLNSNIEVDELQIMFIVGGGETAYGDAEGSSVWAHASSLSPLFSSDNTAPPVADGVTLMDHFANGKYSRFGEMQGGHAATIGIIAHELGHAIWGLPDLYDRDESSGGIGYFGLMGAGIWTAKEGEFFGSSPTHMCAWSKLEVEWIEPQEINQTTNNIAMNASHTNSNNILKIASSNPSEYFLVESRSPVGYDAGLFRLSGVDFEGGIAIWHIDETQSSSQNDDETHKLVDLEEANAVELDESKDNHGKRENLFYLGNKTLFDDTSSPNSKSYNGNSTNISVNNISAIGNAAGEYIIYLDVSR